MQTSEMDRKREAFLEHLKQKYPHHATAIMGHQERLRDQTRSPKLSQSPQPSNLGEQAEHLSEASADSLEAMSEGESPTPFSRGSRTRASLPVVRSTNQTKERSLGVLYLQYGDETKQLRMPNEITSADTIRALFVSAFPQQLTMKILESPSVAIYIKDESRNVYYELNDVRNIQDRSFLKVYNKDPAHAFNHTPKTMNGDMRMQREIAYARGEGPGVPRPGSTAHPSHAIPNSPPSTPIPHSMPPSPSRIPYGGARTMVVPGNATIPRDRLSSMPVSRSISPSPSAILERRDVKPDEDLSAKSLALFRNEGLYADPFLFHEGRMSIASSHGGHPLDVPDHVIAYHRTAIRSASAYCNPALQAEMHLEQSLYRQKSRKYPDSHLPTLGSKTPPASPHRVGDIRMIDMLPHHIPPHALQPDRASPSRQSFKKELGAAVYIEKPRNPPVLAGMVDVGPPLTEKQIFGYSTMTSPKDKETRERMQAMEKQIASLTGLVQSALFKGPNTSNSKDASSEKMKTMVNKSLPDGAGTPHVSGGKISQESSALFSQPPPAGSTAIQMSLYDMRRNVSELRLQLRQMRELQLQNQELLRAMMKKAEQEINGKVIETLKRLEDPVQRQRHLVEQERQKYLHEEEKIVKKLCELEDFVEDLKKDSTSAGRVVTLKDVEDGAFLLRQVGEAVAALKGEFPTLQNKMRAILRIEVEAVRFLKEEPHKLDSLLKRVRSMTDVLTMLRRHVTDGLLKGADAAQVAQYVAMEKATAAEILKNQEESAYSHGPPSQSTPGGNAESQASSVKSEVVPLSTMTVHHAQSSPVVIHQSQHSSALVNHTQSLPGGPPASPPASTQESTATGQAVQTPQSPPPPTNGSTMQSLFIEEIHSASSRNRAVSIEESSEDAGPTLPAKAAKGPQEEQGSARSQPPPPVAVSSSKDEEEEEGDRIMAELQAFQKCSFMDVNSNCPVEQARTDSQVKDTRPGAVTQPKERKNLEFFQEDIRKSDVAHENGPQMESRMVCDVTTGILKTSDPPEDRRERKAENNVSDESGPSESKNGDLMKENAIPSRSVPRDTRDYSQKNVSLCPGLSGIGLSESEANKGPQVLGLQYTVVKTANQKVSYGKLKEISQQELENLDKSNLATNTDTVQMRGNNLAGASKSTPDQEAHMFDYGQVVLRSKGAKNTNESFGEDGEAMASSPTEDNSSTDNIAFMITKTAVQVLSSGEVHDIVSRKGGDIQTVNIDARKEGISQQEGIESEEPVVCLDKKPVIIIFDEPMDIRSAYKRLSTIFEECDEELERMMTEEKIEEEEEENEEPRTTSQVFANSFHSNQLIALRPGEQPKGLIGASAHLAETRIQRGLESSKTELNQDDLAYSPNSDEKADLTEDQFESPKKKFKFKFPKKQLAALTQAIRTGTKTGKKTLQVVVYEEEEEDGTLKQHKEAKRFEISRSLAEETPKTTGRKQEQLSLEISKPASRTDEIRKNTYKTLDSLEQTIKQLENTISEMSPRALADAHRDSVTSPSHVAQESSPRNPGVVEEAPAPLEPPPPVPAASRKGSGGPPQTSRMPVPLSSKTRPAGAEKPSKQPKLQDPRQYRQANGSAKKAGGDWKATSPSLPASKIPAFSPSSGKSSSMPAPSGDAPNPANPPTKSSIPSSNLLSPHTGRTAYSSSQIPSVSNGSLKFQNPTHPGKGHHLSFSPQTQNGRPSPSSSSSSPPSPASPTSLNQGAKSIRTIHTPSFTSYKAQNGNPSKPSPPAAKETSSG
ncbi:sickle tail protein homolog isoform X4 [Antechinus flavipes]|uniref:sickle tail protein homolog isoform X4 n=1 Tax=Antechinus flavipes TaxID=38775 RepID=UPI002235D285|nr:sickle tail protein homolog isoform X4 [Antechinus flavipes]